MNQNQNLSFNSKDENHHHHQSTFRDPDPDSDSSSFFFLNWGRDHFKRRRGLTFRFTQENLKKYKRKGVSESEPLTVGKQLFFLQRERNTCGPGFWSMSSSSSIPHLSVWGEPLIKGRGTCAMEWREEGRTIGTLSSFLPSVLQLIPYDRRGNRPTPTPQHQAKALWLLSPNPKRLTFPPSSKRFSLLYFLIPLPFSERAEEWKSPSLSIPPCLTYSWLPKEALFSKFTDSDSEDHHTSLSHTRYAMCKGIYIEESMYKWSAWREVSLAIRNKGARPWEFQ